LAPFLKNRFLKNKSIISYSYLKSKNSLQYLIVLYIYIFNHFLFFLIKKNAQKRSKKIKIMLQKIKIGTPFYTTAFLLCVSTGEAPLFQFYI